MAKPKTYYVCNECGAESPQWFGKCPACGTYNSLEEQLASASGGLPSRGGSWQVDRANGKSITKVAKARASLTFDQISDRQLTRWISGYEELDRVLGGGIVPGSLVLIGGDPGIGKSTLLLQVSNQLAQNYRILYVCGEESGQQVKLRASRLGVTNSGNISNEDEPEDKPQPQPQTSPSNGHSPAKSGKDAGADLYVLPETDLEEVLREIDSLKPNVA
ncbi:MAG TPA: DNA repair protein RadA, partial [Cyanobacteria bacterium UBA11049]|nr:DNA repair protein RadA [Cyanobacteria bacterium UBA11049]